ncbi:hypothetical protein [Campylobacter sp.]|uniref:hypothetical protein n=1 Tax=Campylobacter sp. TaxID=205 RepID=UPI002706252A|nr:hypothetical protein [Campylobacter sp.]
MSKLKLISCSVLTVFFAGCFDMGAKVANLPARQSNQPVIKKMQSIRGVIEGVSFSESGWCYDIRSIDTSNQKLPSGKFCADRHYFNTGDLIYANVFGDRIKNMYLISSGYENSKKSYKNFNQSPQNSKPKRIINKKQVVELPKNEKISFD